jgi:hypothetical protein
MLLASVYLIGSRQLVLSLAIPLVHCGMDSYIDMSGV